LAAHSPRPFTKHKKYGITLDRYITLFHTSRRHLVTCYDHDLTALGIPAGIGRACDLSLLGDAIYLTYGAWDSLEYKVTVHVVTDLQTLVPRSVSVRGDNDSIKWERTAGHPAPDWVMRAWHPVEEAFRELAAPDSDDVDPRVPLVALAVRLHEIYGPARLALRPQVAITAA
jgi:hypothetical protein